LPATPVTVAITLTAQVGRAPYQTGGRRLGFKGWRRPQLGDRDYSAAPQGAATSRTVRPWTSVQVLPAPTVLHRSGALRRFRCPSAATLDGRLLNWHQPSTALVLLT